MFSGKGKGLAISIGTSAIMMGSLSSQYVVPPMASGKFIEDKAQPTHFDSNNHIIESVREFDQKVTKTTLGSASSSILSLKPLSYIPEFRANKSFELATKVKSLLNLTYGWDGKDAEPLSNSTINEALKFIELLDLDTPMPHIAPASDGELAFSWKDMASYLEISFYGEGVLYWFFKSEEKSVTDDENFSGKAFSREVNNYIRKFSK